LECEINELLLDSEKRARIVASVWLLLEMMNRTCPASVQWKGRKGAVNKKYGRGGEQKNR